MPGKPLRASEAQADCGPADRLHEGKRHPVRPLPRKPRGEVLDAQELLLQGEGVRQGLRPVEGPDGAPGAYMSLDFACSP